MAAQGDLTTLENVKAWLNTGASAFPGTDDKLLTRMVTSASRWVENYLSRSIVPAQYAEKYNGSGTDRQFLRNRPVVSVSAVAVDGITIQPSSTPPLGTGFLFDDTTVGLVFARFPTGFQNVSVTYVAGYQASQAITVPTNGTPFKVGDLNQRWNIDRGVAYASTGAALVLVTADPAQGQYKVSAATDGNFQYTFNSADGDAAVTVTYGYTPADLEQVVIELIGETYKRRTRIGEESKTMQGGQNVTFSTKVLNEQSMADLNQFKNVVPV